MVEEWVEKKTYNYPAGTQLVEDEDGKVVTKQEYGTSVDFEMSRKNRIPIELPGQGVLMSHFANTIANVISPENLLFYRTDSKDIVEIGKIRLPDGSIINDGFMELKPARFVTVLEKYFTPWTEIHFKNGKTKRVNKSMNQTTASIVLAAENFIDKMPVINRIFPVQMPILYNGELTFPKEGYDKRFGSWLPHDAPRITNPNMTIQEARELMYFIYGEFCFQDHESFINAIAGLLTPFLRGLYPAFNTRAPIFAYLANRERAGKDFCAGITGQVYEGQALEEPPISDGEIRSTGKNDELKKKILAAMMMGRKRLHSANNKGKMNSAVFEAVTTAERFSDRKLGRNEILTFDNEIDFSFSGNLDIRLTPDLANRCRIIRLFLDVEDANSRNFKTPNLHKWVKENRGLVLSAMYAFVREWYEKGMPEGKVPFTSFPQWAKICGGIMECAGYDNPCGKEKTEMLGVALDNETDEMKTLFETMFENFKDKWIEKHEIIEFIKHDDELFNYIDWQSKSDQTRFGIKLN